MTTKKLTVVDWIVLAARDLGTHESSFTAEDLVVRAWQLSSDRFGLQGYATQYPDSNRVLSKIMGRESPLRKRGLLRKIGEKRYQLTDVGRHVADDLDQGGARTDRRLADLKRGFVVSLRRALQSTALSKFARGETITFSDVAGFWNISARSTAHQFADRTKETDTAIELALRHAHQAGGRAVLPGKVVVVVEESQLRLLSDLSSLMRDSFAGEIEVIKSRKG